MKSSAQFGFRQFLARQTAAKRSTSAPPPSASLKEPLAMPSPQPVPQSLKSSPEAEAQFTPSPSYYMQLKVPSHRSMELLDKIKTLNGLPPTADISPFMGLCLWRLVPHILGEVVPVRTSTRVRTLFDMDMFIDLAFFLDFATQEYDSLHDEAILAALTLLERLCLSNKLPVTNRNIKTLFCLACSLSTKMLQDQSRAQTIARSQVFSAATGISPRLFASAEFELCKLLDWNATVSADDFLSTFCLVVEIVEERAILEAPAVCTLLASLFDQLSAELGGAVKPVN